MFFAEIIIKKTHLKIQIHMEFQTAKTILKNKLGRLALPNFKFTTKPVIKTVWYQHTDIKINGIELKAQKQTLTSTAN